MSGTMKTSAYVASNLGFTAEGRYYMRGVLYPRLEALGLKLLDPWAWQIGLSEKQIMEGSRKGLSDEVALKIGKTNLTHIANCNILIAVVNGPDIDSGVAGEITDAAQSKKPVFALRTDFRFSGDAIIGINLQPYTYIQTSGGALTWTLEELEDKVREWLRRNEPQVAHTTNRPRPIDETD